MIDFNRRVVWIPVKNTTAETIPGGGLMRVIDPGQDEEGNWLVGKPNADGDTTVIVNGEAEIPPGEFGLGHRDTMAVLMYDTTEDRPITGDLYGSKADSWQAHINQMGFKIDSAGNGRANATREGVGSQPRVVTCRRSFAVEFTPLETNETNPYVVSAEIEVPFDHALVFYQTRMNFRQDPLFSWNSDPNVLSDPGRGFSIIEWCRTGDETLAGSNWLERSFYRRAFKAADGTNQWVYFGTGIGNQQYVGQYEGGTWTFDNSYTGILLPDNPNRNAKMTLMVTGARIQFTAALTVTAVEMGGVTSACYFPPSPPPPPPPPPPLSPLPPTQPPIGPEPTPGDGGDPLDPNAPEPGPIPPIYFPPW